MIFKKILNSNSTMNAENIILTKYEKARIIGLRAEQIARGAIPKVDVRGMISPVDIATKEFQSGAIPISVVRKLPSGQKFKINFVDSEK